MPTQREMAQKLIDAIREASAEREEAMDREGFLPDHAAVAVWLVDDRVTVETSYWTNQAAAEGHTVIRLWPARDDVAVPVWTDLTNDGWCIVDDARRLEWEQNAPYGCKSLGGEKESQDENP